MIPLGVVNQQAITSLDLWSNILLSHDFDGSTNTEYCADSAGSHPINTVSLGEATGVPANLGQGRGTAGRWQAITGAIAPLASYSGDFTWLCWFKTAIIGSSEWPAITRFQGNTSSGSPYAFAANIIPINSGLPRQPYIALASGAQVLYLTDPLADNTWYFIGLTYTATSNLAQAYFNGQPNVSLNQAVTFPSTCYLAYGSTWSSSVDFKGYHAANRMFLRALTAEEISAHYNSGAGLGYLG